MKSFGKYIKETYADSGLGKWFGKGGKGGKTEGGWDRYNSKGEKVGKCGDADEGDAYAACLSAEKANKLGKDGIASFVKRKRAAQKKAGDSSKGGESKKGQKPTYVATKANEEVIDEKNEPTNPKLWAQAKAQAKKKFDVYPSAYANAWASKWYKSKGGGWRKVSEQIDEGRMQNTVKKMNNKQKQILAKQLNKMDLSGYGDYMADVRNVHKFKDKDLERALNKVLPSVAAMALKEDCGCDEPVIMEAEYQGKKVKLNDPIRTSEVPTKKFKVYVQDGDKVKVVRFGDPNMEIKRDDPERIKSFRARHNCDNPGPKTKARYWSCYQWRRGAKVDN